MDLKTQTLEPKREELSDVEQVTVTLLNISFGDALKNRTTLGQILPEPADSLNLVGFSEATPGVRDDVVAAIEVQGYRAVIPEGEGSKVDIVWAVSPALEVRHSIAHRFVGRVESRPGKRHKRDAGTLIVEAVTPNGRVLRLSSERFAPPLRGKGAQRLHVLGMAAVLDGLDVDDDTVDIDISGGDYNRVNGPTESDKRMWQDKGYVPVVRDGEVTYNVRAAGRLERAAGRMLRIVGRFPTMEFDKMYARPGRGRELVQLDGDSTGEGLSSNQIGYTQAEAIWVGGTDHAAIRTMISLPSRTVES